jgi:zeaxanthin glucosyltransferase
VASIAIVTLPEPGHLNPSECLRKALVEAGHRVTYIVKPGGEQYFDERSLPYELVRWGHFADVALVEASATDLAALAYEFHVDVLKLSATYSQRYDPELPPVTSDLPPQSSAAGRALIADAWRLEHERLREREWYRHAAEWAERNHGFPRQWIDDRAAMEVTFRVPELTLAPRELDFERKASDLFYAGPCIDLERDESGRAPLDSIRQDRPIAYCAFGTQIHRYANAIERISLLMEAVLSWDAAEISEVPENVTVLRNAPQLALLRRAAIMLTHGGLNSVKEALACGVPLIVLPFDHDQPGNAARVAFHRYGHKVQWGGTSAPALAALVAEVLSDIPLKLRVSDFKARLSREIRERNSVRAFEACWNCYRQLLEGHLRQTAGP